jgi:hypothetical protein
MDSKFLEFWGSVFLSAARGRRQMEDFNRWIEQGFQGVREFGTLLARIYGLEDKPAGNEESGDAWEEAIRNFQKSYDEYLSLMGVVPREDYRRLAEQYERLKERVAEQEETIRRLRRSAGWESTAQDEIVKGMQELVSRQTEQFQELVKSCASGLEAGQPRKEKTGGARKRKTGKGETHDGKGS